MNEDCLEFCNEYKAREVIKKYCSFMPYEIYLEKANAPEEFETIDPADKKDDDVVVETINEDHINLREVQNSLHVKRIIHI